MSSEDRDSDAENKSTLAVQTDVLENPDILEKIFSYFREQTVSDDGEPRVPFPISKYNGLCVADTKVFL